MDSRERGDADVGAVVSRLLAVNPQKHALAGAFFDGGMLLQAGFYATLSDMHLAAVDELVIEVPRIFPGARQTARPNDIIDLAFAAGKIVGELHDLVVVIVYPHDWKKQVPKPERASEPYAIELRIMKILSGDEARAVVWPVNARHRWDVADAIGIGLHYLRRTR